MEAGEKPAQPSKGIRESLYSHIKVSVRTMNIVILFVSILLIASIVIGVVQGGN